MKLRVTGLQMPVSTDIAANVRQIEAGIAEAAQERADLLLTPEGSLSGYHHRFDRKAVQEALAAVTVRARAARVGLALGTCFEEADGRSYNQVRIYRPDGEYLGFHSKTLLCAGVKRSPDDEFNHFSVQPLRTFDWAPGVRLGALICNDMWANPYWTPMPDSHLTQQLTGMGARVILHAVNGGRDGSEMSKLNWQYHEINLRMRAGAGRTWIVTVDNAAPVELQSSSPSGVLNPAGNWVCQAPNRGRQLFVHTLDLAEAGLSGA